MPPSRRYVVVESFDKEELGLRVEALLAAGYELIEGGLVVVPVAGGPQVVPGGQGVAEYLYVRELELAPEYVYAQDRLPPEGA